MKQLKSRDYLYIGTMLFGMLFGAGNLIFPVQLGQESGSAYSLATIGFLISAIGLPFLALVALALSQTTDVYTLSSRVSKRFAKGFTILLYLVIGPFFALPRLAAVSFEIGIKPNLAAEQHTLGLWGYAIFFFAIAYTLSRKPGKLLDYVGKFLTPIFLVVLSYLLLLAIIQPMGNPSDLIAQEKYVNAPLITGILDGYQTLDLLATLAFGVAVVNAIKGLGVTEPRMIAKDMLKAGSFSVLLMGVIYWLLAFAGASSVATLGSLSENGGQALQQITHHYLGTGGSLLLAAIVFFGCLKTAVGLLTSFSATFNQMYPSLSYQKILVVVSIFTTIAANVGLNQIISWAIPVLFFLYPLAIVLVLLTLSDRFFNGYSSVYRWTIAITFIIALFEGFTYIPESATMLLPLVNFSKMFIQLLPFSKIGLAWLLPSFLGFIIGYSTKNKN